MIIHDNIKYYKYQHLYSKNANAVQVCINF